MVRIQPYKVKEKNPQKLIKIYFQVSSTVAMEEEKLHSIFPRIKVIIFSDILQGYSYS